MLEKSSVSILSFIVTLFSLVLVLSVYYVTMPKEILEQSKITKEEETKITQTNIIEALKAEDDTNTQEEINKLKNTISSDETTTEDRNKAFDSLKTLTGISSKEELLEEKIKNTHNLDSFIKIEDDQIRVVIDSEEKSKTLANKIMRTIQENFDNKQYIVVEFK